MRRNFKAPERRNPMFTSPADFTKNKELGSGAFATVFDVTHKVTGRHYAMKQINLAALSLLDQENVEKELEIHTTLNHEHVIRLYDFFIEENSVLLILEIAGRGNLFRYINRKRINEAEVKKFFVQTSLAIDYLHTQGVIMRDLKPENLLMDQDYNIKLCDLGWAARLSDTAYCRAKAGTYAYMSPESLQGQLQDTKSDVWSLGVLLYELSYNREPYSGNSCNDQLRKIQTNVLNFQLPIDPEAKLLITAILRQNPRERPGMDFIFGSKFVENYSKESNTTIKRSVAPENKASDTRFISANQNTTNLNSLQSTVGSTKQQPGLNSQYYPGVPNKDTRSPEMLIQQVKNVRPQDSNQLINAPHLSDANNLKPLLYKPRNGDSNRVMNEKERIYTTSNGQDERKDKISNIKNPFVNSSLNNLPNTQGSIPQIKIITPQLHSVKQLTNPTQNVRYTNPVNSNQFNEYGNFFQTITSMENLNSQKIVISENNILKTGKKDSSLSNIDAKSTTNYMYRKARRMDNQSIISKNQNTSIKDVSQNDSRSFSPNLSPNLNEIKGGFMQPGFRVTHNPQNQYQTSKPSLQNNNYLSPQSRLTFFTSSVPRPTSANVRLKSQTDVNEYNKNFLNGKNKMTSNVSFTTLPQDNQFVTTGGYFQLNTTPVNEVGRLTAGKNRPQILLQNQPSGQNDSHFLMTPPKLQKSNSSIFIKARQN
jgi:serine/threonine protein kinase